MARIINYTAKGTRRIKNKSEDNYMERNIMTMVLENPDLCKEISLEEYKDKKAAPCNSDISLVDAFMGRINMEKNDRKQSEPIHYEL